MKKILVVILMTLVIVGCGNSKVKNEMANTTWIASDGSELIFEEKEFNWYKEEGVHDDNVYSGTYEYYRGSKAVEFITTELSEYGVTKEELEQVFESNENYSEDNFVVFNMNYTNITIEGEISTPNTSLVPWYGFIVEDGKELDVANMNTATRYQFEKK